MEHGADKIRINPGNIGGEENIRKVVETAKKYHVPIRVGVNSGSLEKPLVKKYNGVTAQGLVESALDKVAMLEKYDFHDMVVKMNIRDQRNMNLLLNLCKSFGSFHCWNSTANDLASSLLKSKNLFDRLFHIFCLCF